MLYQIIQQDPEPLLTLNPELPVRLAAVVHRMLVKDPDQRYGTMQEVGHDLQQILVALRRSRSRSALPGPPGPPPEEVRGRVREYVTKGRAHLDAGRMGQARHELAEALALDPDAEEACELVWRGVKAAAAAHPADRDGPAPDPATEKRVEALLARVGDGASDKEARNALAELALIAPDDARVVEAVRIRAGRGTDQR